MLPQQFHAKERISARSVGRDNALFFVPHHRRFMHGKSAAVQVADKREGLLHLICVVVFEDKGNLRHHRTPLPPAAAQDTSVYLIPDSATKRNFFLLRGIGVYNEGNLGYIFFILAVVPGSPTGCTARTRMQSSYGRFLRTLIQPNRTF
jgi:hypothetical protein